MRAAGIALSVAIGFSAMCYSIAIYNVEEVKQQAFMMKACADAKLEFRFSWGRPVCIRPQ